MFSKNFVVVYDANVLFPFYLRDLLIQLSCDSIYRAKWTNKINDEWSSNLLKRKPDISSQAIERTVEQMNYSNPDSLVNNYEDLIQSVVLPDEDDRHVLAAAIKCNAQVIVTFNLTDFPEEELNKYSIEAQHPDYFLENVIDLSGKQVVKSIKTVKERYKKKPKSIEDLVEIYRKSKLDNLASFLEQNKNEFD